MQNLQPFNNPLWDFQKRDTHSVIALYIYSLQELKDTTKRLIKAIPEVRKVVYGMKKMAANLIQVEGTALEGDEISSKMNYE